MYSKVSLLWSNLAPATCEKHRSSWNCMYLSKVELHLCFWSWSKKRNRLELFLFTWSDTLDLYPEFLAWVFLFGTRLVAQFMLLVWKNGMSFCVFWKSTSNYTNTLFRGDSQKTVMKFWCGWREIPSSPTYEQVISVLRQKHSTKHFVFFSSVAREGWVILSCIEHWGKEMKQKSAYFKLFTSDFFILIVTKPTFEGTVDG